MAHVRRKSKIGSRRFKNINKITRAMEMVARPGSRAEQRIADLRPYAEGCGS